MPILDEKLQDLEKVTIHLQESHTESERLDLYINVTSKQKSRSEQSRGFSFPGVGQQF